MQSNASVQLSNAKYFCKQAYNIMLRNNPFFNIIANIKLSINNVLTANKRLQVAKYRVGKLRYRVNQMEKIIYDNNPYNQSGGGKINHIR